jgi:hypothetical protein
VQIAKNISLDPLDFRPALIDWMMSVGDSAERLSVGAKLSLWRLLAWDYQGDSDTTINPDELDLDLHRSPILELPTTPIYAGGDGTNKNAYDIHTSLDPAVSKRLMDVVSRRLILAIRD